MAGMIKSSVHHFDGCGGVGLAGNGGGSGKDGGRAAICSASRVSTGIDTVETTFGVVRRSRWAAAAGLAVQGAGCRRGPGGSRLAAAIAWPSATGFWSGQPCPDTSIA